MAPKNYYKFHLYFDEGFPQLVGNYLKKCGYSVQTTKQARKAGIGLSDIKQLEFARKKQALFLTLDGDFARIENARLKKHPGIIIIESAEPSSKKIEQILQIHLKKLTQNYCYQKIIKLTISKKKIIKVYKI